MTAAADLSSRYGGRVPRERPDLPERRRMSRPALIGTVLALAAAIGVAAWYGLSPGPTPEGTTTVSYDVVDSSLTRTTIAVYPDDTRDIVCAVRAVNAQEATVGFTEVDIPADPAADASTPVIVSTDISTTQRAVSGHFESCWYADDPQI